MSDTQDADHQLDADDSKQRTQLSHDRTIMANERTFNSWTGTGLGVPTVAIGLKAVFGAFEPTWIAKAVASLFVVIAIFVFYAALRQAGKTLKRLDETAFEPVTSKNFCTLSILLILASLATGAILWSL